MLLSVAYERGCSPALSSSTITLRRDLPPLVLADCPVLHLYNVIRVPPPTCFLDIYAVESI
ncbi:hypothetical protein FKP32DRAFT_1754147, partial [Trametes sanguinea]